MNKRSSIQISDDADECPELTAADLKRATFRIGLKPAPLMQQITLDLDARLVAYFKGKAGAQGFETLINETLRAAVVRDTLEESLDEPLIPPEHVIEREELEESLRRIVREELQRGV